MLSTSRACKAFHSLLALMALAGGVNAAVVYCGVGNDDFSNDINVALGKIRPCLNRPGDSGSGVFDQTGTQIIDKLSTARQNCQPGDIYIFHYAGHGDIRPNPMSANPEGDGNQGIIGLESDLTNGIGASDDEIAAQINNFPTCCAVLTIFDSCYSGEMIDEPTDINRGMVITTADNVCTAPGSSIFLPWWCAAFEVLPGATGPAGDLNGDGRMTLGELYQVLAQITQQGHPSNPQAVNFYAPDDPHLNYAVWEVPTPSGMVILGFAAFGAVRRRRR